MPTILDQIMSRTLISVQERKAAANMQAVERRAAAHRPRGFQACAAQGCEGGAGDYCRAEEGIAFAWRAAFGRLPAGNDCAGI